MNIYTFCVITKVPDPDKGESGNLASAGPIYQQTEEPSESNNWRGKVGPPPPEVGLGLLINFRVPVFAAGEIVILDSEYGREVCGAMRMPSKWDVEVEHFTDIEKAIDRACAVPEEEITL